MIEVRCYASLEQAAFLRDQIDAVNLASRRPDPFSTFAFYENFVRHDEFSPAGAPWPLWFLTAMIDDRLVGYLVLKRSKVRVWGLHADKLDFLVTHDTDRPHLVASAEHELAVSQAFYRYLVGRRREWSLLEFQQQDEGSMLLPPPPGVDLKGCVLRRWPSMDNGTIVVRWDSLEAYFKAFSKKFRSNVSRQMRTLLAAGEVEVLSSSDPSVTPALFELCRCIEPRSWKSQADAAISRHPKRIEYFQGLLDARQPMRVSIHVLLLDGIPIAGLITGSFGPALQALHIVYDDHLSALAPGSAVLMLGMRQAISGGYAVFNLLSGFGYYKQRWLADMTPTRSAQIYRVGSLLFWRRMLGDLQRRLIRRPAGPAEVLFNPTRREVAGSGDDRDGAPSGPQVSQREREQIVRLIEQVRAGPCEHLSPAGLASIMPFETQRPSRA